MTAATDAGTEAARGPRRVRLGPWIVDLESGELSDENPGGGDLERRLPPQPTRLLALLVERAGEVVGHQEIRERLWPGVEVDFENGLHFCVRQIRSALGDDAGEPRFVETLPRRGYRLVARPEPLAEPASARRRPARAWLPIALLAVLAAGLASVLLSLYLPPAASPAAPRLGIAPLAPGAGFEPVFDAEQVAQLLLLDLGREVDRLEVVGPTTTAAYGDAPLHRMTAELRLDYVVHARYLREGETTQVLMELIRARDGAHVWVERYRTGTGAETVAGEMAAAVRHRLSLPAR